MPANWANWTLSVVAQSDLVILVVNLTIASLRQGTRQLHLLRSQGVDSAKIVVLVNRVEQRLFKTIDLEDAAKALGHPVKLSVHNDYASMSAANNQGVIVNELNRKSKVVRDFKAIAEQLPSLIAQRD
jgi:pilus assembly protein CpaE